MTDKRTQELIDRGWYRAAKERIQSNPSGTTQEVSEETKKFLCDRIGRIQFKSAGAKRER